MTKTPTLAPKACAGIEKLHLYTPGQIRQGPGVRKLSSNENLYGPSPKVIEAVRNTTDRLWLYPSVDHYELRSEIAKVHDLPSDQILCGNGSDEILHLIAQSYAGAGDEVIMTSHGFEIYGIVAHASGADLVIAEEVERRVDVSNIISAITKKTKIVFIANPGNPTSTMISKAEIERLIQALPTHVLLVLDGAYAEFVEKTKDQTEELPLDGGASYVKLHENVIMTRTFSKLYGLGGLRIGWAFGPQEVIDTLNKIRGPFNLSQVALSGATAAMKDQDYYLKLRKQIIIDREELALALRQQGWGVDVSYTNFLLVRFEDEPQAMRAFHHLDEEGILVRRVGHYGLPEALRITVGTSEDCLRVKNNLHRFMELERG